MFVVPVLCEHIYIYRIPLTGILVLLTRTVIPFYWDSFSRLLGQFPLWEFIACIYGRVVRQRQVEIDADCEMRADCEIRADPR